MLYQNSSKRKEESALLRTGLSRAISSLSITFSLKSLLSLAKTSDLFTFTEEILNGKRYFLCSVNFKMKCFKITTYAKTPVQ